jgi:predicted Zn-dependent peptidase
VKRVALCLVALAGCAPRYHERPLSFAALPGQALPQAATVPAPKAATRADVPPPGLSPDTVLSDVVSTDAGVHLTVLTRSELPVAITAVVIHAGSASDGTDIGAAQLGAELLAVALDATDVRVGADAVVLELRHSPADFNDVAGAIARALAKPPAAGFAAARRRALARARVEPETSAREALARELYELPTGRHPYGHPHAPKSALAALPERAVRDWLGRELGPESCELIVVGAVNAAVAEAATRHAFGHWKKTTAAAPAPPAPLPATGFRIVIADHPGLASAEVQLGTLYSSDAAAARDVALSLARDLAPDGVGWFSEEHRSGPALVGLTRTVPAGDALGTVEAMLSALSRAEQADADATEVATRRAVDEPLLDLSSLAGAAAELERATISGAPANALDTRRRARRDAAPDAVRAAARRLNRRDALVVVVSGDAKTLAAPLSAIGRVVVVNPERDFVIERTVSYDPSRKHAP